ncbi:AraC family transcriptional regulator [Rhodoferax aquaticus]|nr:AraC family transcriptional regulator [Rhodoferax aquaticus]
MQSLAVVHPVYARLLRMLLQKAEVDSDRVLASAQLAWDTLQRDGAGLPRDTVIPLVRAAMAATGKPWLGLDLGWQAPVSAHGPLGYAAVTAPDLHHALAALARFGAVRDDSFAWTYQATAQGGVLQATARLDWGDARTFVMDTVIAAFMRVIESALGQWPCGVRLELPVPKPPWASQYLRVQPLELLFDQPSLRFCFSARTLALPCIGADAHAHANACHECELALRPIAQRSYREQVNRVLEDAATGRYPQLTEVAAQCGVSSRTLMRQLQHEGTSFQQLLDTHRKVRALALLQHSTHTVEEIAAQLGYVDTSNFSRTVRRWFGVSPKAMRQTPSA